MGRRFRDADGRWTLVVFLITNLVLLVSEDKNGSDPFSSTDGCWTLFLLGVQEKREATDHFMSIIWCVL